MSDFQGSVKNYLNSLLGEYLFGTPIVLVVSEYRHDSLVYCQAVEKDRLYLEEQVLLLCSCYYQGTSGSFIDYGRLQILRKLLNTLLSPF